MSSFDGCLCAIIPCNRVEESRPGIGDRGHTLKNELFDYFPAASRPQPRGAFQANLNFAAFHAAKSDVCDGSVHGAADSAAVKRTPSRARRSRWGSEEAVDSIPYVFRKPLPRASFVGQCLSRPRVERRTAGRESRRSDFRWGQSHCRGVL